MLYESLQIMEIYKKIDNHDKRRHIFETKDGELLESRQGGTEGK